MNVKNKILYLLPEFDDIFRATQDMIGVGKNRTPVVNEHPKVNRNDPCPCGSGKKYKKCCLKKPSEQQTMNEN